MNLYELIETGANVKVEVSSKDLVQFAETLIDKAKELHEINAMHDAQRKAQTAPGEEQWLTTEETAKMCKCTKTTLWSWEKHGYLVPSRLGRRKVYALADINKLLLSKGVRQQQFIQ